MDHRQLADELISVAGSVGQLQMRHFCSGVTVEQKSDASPVTVADRQSEEMIVAALATIAPGIPVVAEEAMSEGADLPPSLEHFFLVDPLDGTREFISGRGEFTVNIALIDNGRPVFGLLYAPALSRLFMTLGPGEAVEAQLAAENGAQGLGDLELQRLQPRSPDMEALIVVASRSHLDPATEQLLSKYRVGERVSAGSSLKFCLLASGEADLYPRLGRTMEWDTAAGHAILNAAGGCVMTEQGEPLGYAKRDVGFANPGFIAWGCAQSATVS